MSKLWSVRAFVYDEDKEKTVTNRKANGDITGVFPYYIRRLSVVAKNLTFKKAKEIRNQHSQFGAMIFPDIKEDELKVIQLG